MQFAWRTWWRLSQGLEVCVGGKTAQGAKGSACEGKGEAGERRCPWSTVRFVSGEVFWRWCLCRHVWEKKYPGQGCPPHPVMALPGSCLPAVACAVCSGRAAELRCFPAPRSLHLSRSGAAALPKYH